MKRKEVLIGVIGGCIGAFLTMAVGLFTPMGVVTQSQNQDGVFGKITCREIEVVDGRGDMQVRIYAGKYDGFNGGRVEVFGKSDGYADEQASTGISEYGGHLALARQPVPKSGVVIGGNQYGGRVAVLNKMGTICAGMRSTERGGIVDVWGGPRNAAMQITEHGGSVAVVRMTDDGDAVRRFAAMSITEHGGRISVGGEGEKKAVMRVDEDGNGTFSSWDRNGNRLK